MNLKLRTKGTIAELIIETGNSKIVEDLVSYNKEKGWHINDETIEQFITLANDSSRFNSVSDVDFVKKIFDAFLSDGEKEEFLNRLNETV